MSMLLRRRFITSEPAPVVPTDWKKVYYAVGADTLTGDTTINPMKLQIPSGYRYAVALVNNTSNLENGSFLGAIFLPSRSEVIGLRYYQNKYNGANNMNTSEMNVILRRGQTVTIYYRTTPIGTDVPDTRWDYACIEPGPIDSSAALQAAIANVGQWQGLLAVPDIDFSTIPSTNRTFCGGVFTNNNGTKTIGFVRVNNGAYAGVNTASDMSNTAIVETGTKVACFYI